MLLADTKGEGPMKTVGLILKSQRKENIQIGQEQGAGNQVRGKQLSYGTSHRKSHLALLWVSSKHTLKTTLEINHAFCSDINLFSVSLSFFMFLLSPYHHLIHCGSAYSNNH